MKYMLSSIAISSCIGPPPDQLNWINLCADDAVTLIVAPVTIRELNKKKDGEGASRVIRDRAAARLNFDPRIKGGITTSMDNGANITGMHRR